MYSKIQGKSSTKLEMTPIRFNKINYLCHIHNNLNALSYLEYLINLINVNEYKYEFRNYSYNLFYAKLKYCEMNKVLEKRQLAINNSRDLVTTPILQCFIRITCNVSNKFVHFVV